MLSSIERWLTAPPSLRLHLTPTVAEALLALALHYMTQAASSGPSTSQQSRQSQSHLQGFGD